MGAGEGGQPRHWAIGKFYVHFQAVCGKTAVCFSLCSSLLHRLICIFVAAVAQMKNVACRQILERFRFNSVNVANSHFFTYIPHTHKQNQPINWATASIGQLLVSSPRAQHLWALSLLLLQRVLVAARVPFASS